MWDDDAETGIGGWGDPNDNYVIKTGGFKDLVRAYPVQHKIRRQFLTHPFAQIPLPITPLWPDHNLLGNTTYSQDKVDWIMENCGPGDYFCFQSHGEGAQKIGGGFHVAVGGDLAGTCPIVDAGYGDCTYGAEYTSNGKHLPAGFACLSLHAHHHLLIRPHVLHASRQSRTLHPGHVRYQ